MTITRQQFTRFFVCGIDGTAPNFVGIAKNLEANQVEYDKIFAKSFVRQLCHFGDGSRYFRGPAATGSGLGFAMENAASAILDRYSRDCSEHQRSGRDYHDPDRRCYVLAGYSRGACGIIEVARRMQVSEPLKYVGIKIHAMILFDCVNETDTSVQGVINRGGVPTYSNRRSIVAGASMIPANVENCIHFIRSDDTNSRAETMTKYNGGPVDRTKTKYTPMHLKGTHGGLGGLPYFEGQGDGDASLIREPGSAFATNVSMAEDLQASRTVVRFANTFCANLAIPVSIRLG